MDDAKPPAFKLSVDDLTRVAAESGLQFWTRDKLQGLFALFDTDRDNHIERSEFEYVAKQLLQLIEPKVTTVPEAALPERLKEFLPLGKVAEVLVCVAPLQALDAALEQAVGGGGGGNGGSGKSLLLSGAEAERRLSDAKAALAAGVMRATPVMARVIKRRLSQPSAVLDCLGVIAAGLDFFEGSYNEIFSTIEKSERVEAYREPCSRLKASASVGAADLRAWLHAEHQAAASALQRTGEIATLLADASSLTVRAGFDQVLRSVQTKLPRASSDRFGAPLKPGPLKRSARVLEKCLLRVDDEGNADRVCDMRRAMVVVSSILELGRVLEVFNALHNQGVIRLVRVKDRIAQPAAGWRDCMVNFYIAADPARHVCEVQVAHAKMLTARAGLDGHAVYGRVRNATEQLEKLRVGEAGYLLKLAKFVDKYGLEAPSLEGTQWGLQKSGLCDDDTEVLCALWMKGGKLLQLKELQLAHNHIGDAGLAALANAFASRGPLPHFKKLDLSDNDCGDAGMGTLAEVLGAGAVPTLEKLLLSSNDIGDDGAAFLASALAHLPNLVELTLDDNAISDEGLASLAAAFALGALPQLRKLALDDNYITGDGLAGFAAAMMAPSLPDAVWALPALEMLDLDGNEFGPYGCAELAAVLRSGAMPDLKILEMDDDHALDKNISSVCEERSITVR